MKTKKPMSRGANLKYVNRFRNFKPNLCHVLKGWREYHGFSIRMAAALIGIKHPTLWRFERETAKVDGETLSKILCWLISSEKKNRKEIYRRYQELRRTD